MEFKCEVCRKPAHQKCSGCLSVHYCSPAHQKEHWKSHKRNCSYFVIRNDPEFGKGFYASRDIKAGTIIHEEKPFVFTPSWPVRNFDCDPACVGCGVIKQRQRHLPPHFKSCSGCNWPYCSPECLQIHTDNECKIFVSKQLIFPPVSKIEMMDIPDLTALIRTAVAKKKHPEVFQQIMQLRSRIDGEDEADFIRGDLSIEEELASISAFVNADDLEISHGDFKKLLKILRFNCLFTGCRSIELNPLFPFPAPMADYLYPKASQMQHSCVPNCSWEINWKPDFQIRIRTAVQVKKGELLNICYYMKGGTKGRTDRVENIRMRLGQWCKCWRCNDPTELGTFTSAVVCKNKCYKKNKVLVGYMLPEDPLSLDFMSYWQCNLCGFQLEDLVMACKPKEIGDSIWEKELELHNSDLGALITFCKKLIHKNSGKTLHPNHWVIQDATRTIMKYLPKHCGYSMDLPTSQYYVKCGMYLLAIQDVVTPGISYDRAVLQRQIATALDDQVTELCRQKKYKEAWNINEQSLKLHKEALVYFKDDFRNVADHDDPDEISAFELAIKCAEESRDSISSRLAHESKCEVCKKPAQQNCKEAFCGKEEYQNCPNCHLVTYCSTEHQQKHWKSHRKSCSCFVIKEGSGNGKGFFALRNIETGTVILEETPVVYGPSSNILDFDLGSFCITCGGELEIMEVVSPERRCSKCNWPSCSLECHLVHSENECKIFQLAGRKLNFPPAEHFVPEEIRDLVLLIRATILKKKNPRIFQQIMKLRAESTEPDHSDNNIEVQLKKLSPIVNSDGANIDQEELKKLFKILRINCYSTAVHRKVYEPANSRICRTEYVYLKATKMEQSCVPNCSWNIIGSTDLKIRIRVTKKVKKGEALTVNYHVRGCQEGTKQRLETIRQMRGIDCTCKRCTDPSELSTYASGITCKACADKYGICDKLPYFLPEDPLDLSDSAKWKCNRCGQQKLSSVILPPVEQIQYLISKKVEYCLENFKIGTLINYCKTVINKYSGKSLHPNHWILQEATTIIFHHLPAHCGNSLDLETSQYYVKIGLYLLALQNIVSPGMTLYRAILQKNLTNALLEQNTELQSQNRYKESHNNLQNCLKLIKEALNYFQSAGDEWESVVCELKIQICLVISNMSDLAEELEITDSILNNV